MHNLGLPLPSKRRKKKCISLHQSTELPYPSVAIMKTPQLLIAGKIDVSPSARPKKMPATNEKMYGTNYPRPSCEYMVARRSFMHRNKKRDVKARSSKHPPSSSFLGNRVHSLGGTAGRFRGARYYLDSVCRDDLAAVLHLEGDVLQLEGPDLVAESVGIETPLCRAQER